jgi:hypothetical protein
MFSTREKKEQHPATEMTFSPKEQKALLSPKVQKAVFDRDATTEMRDLFSPKLSTYSSRSKLVKKKEPVPKFRTALKQ